MDEEKTEGVTMGDVFRIIKRRIWYILGATVLFTVVMVLVLKFLINPMLATYSMDFRLAFPAGSEDVYPDGSPFFYQDIVSREFLTDAKNSSPSLASVDTDKMFRNGDVIIEAETLTEDGVTTYTGTYTITAEGSYFKSDDQAEDFIKALANAPIAAMRESAKEVNYTFDSEIIKNLPFKERIDTLAEKKADLLSVYDSWVNVYSETYLVRYSNENGTVVRRLKDFRDSVAVLFSESVKQELESELEFGGYHWTGNDEDLEAYIAQLENEFLRNQDEIKAQSDGQTGINDRLIELVTRNNNIAHWVGFDYDAQTGAITRNDEGTLTAENVKAFDEKLNDEVDKLNKEAENLTNVIGSIYARGTTVLFDKQKVTSSGDISTIVGAIGCFVGGFIIACVVTYVVEINRKKKSQKTSDGTSEEPKTEE